MGTPPKKTFAFGMLLLAGYIIVVTGGLWLVGGLSLFDTPIALGLFLAFGFLIVLVGGSWLVKTYRKHFL